MLQLELKLRANSLFAYSEAYLSSVGACYHFHPSVATYYRLLLGSSMPQSNGEQYLIVARVIEMQALPPSTNPKSDIPQTPNFSQRMEDSQPYMSPV